MARRREGRNRGETDKERSNEHKIAGTGAVTRKTPRVAAPNYLGEPERQ